jgi:hypothetical protein
VTFSIQNSSQAKAAEVEAKGGRSEAVAQPPPKRRPWTRLRLERSPSNYRTNGNLLKEETGDRQNGIASSSTSKHKKSTDEGEEKDKEEEEGEEEEEMLIKDDEEKD